MIEKYKAKIVQKSPKKYSVIEFFKERKNKAEAEACKLRQERLRKLYPTWDVSFDHLGEEQLRRFMELLGSKIEGCEGRINMLKKKHYIEKQQELLKLSSDKSSASASNRSHLSFIHNNGSNNYSNSTTLAHHHQTLELPLKPDDHRLHDRLMFQHFHPNLMPATISPNYSTETTHDDAVACGQYDLMIRESCCPPPPSSLCYSNSSNNNNYYPYLQNSNNILQTRPHEANLQVTNNIPAASLMMQEFQSYHHYGYNQHDSLQVYHQKFNYMDQKK